MMWYVQYLRALDVAAARDAEAAASRLARVARGSVDRFDRDPEPRSGRPSLPRRGAAVVAAEVSRLTERIAIALDPESICSTNG